MYSYRKPTKSLGTRLGRGIVDKGFGTGKIFLHEHASHMIIFAGSKNEVVNGGPDDASYYIADGCGVGITCGENITVEDAGGNEQTNQWTVDTFLKLFNCQILLCAKDFSRFAFTLLYKPCLVLCGFLETSTFL